MKLTLIGKLIWLLHNVILGPEFSLSPAESRWLARWGYRRETD